MRVWDAAGCVELAVLGPFHRGGVACLAWSADGRRIVSVSGWYGIILVLFLFPIEEAHLYLMSHRMKKAKSSILLLIYRLSGRL